MTAQLLGRPPEPADAAVGLALVRQPREQVRPVARHLGQERRLAAAAQQVADLRDGEQLGVAAARSGARAARDRDDPGGHQVIDQHVDVDEQVLGRQHRRARQSTTVRTATLRCSANYSFVIRRSWRSALACHPVQVATKSITAASA